MRVRAGVAAAVLGLLGAGLGAGAAAQAAPATGVDDVVAAMGLASEPADYVVLVDTSGSMRADGRYTNVRRELNALVEGLHPEDRVSLLTFDSSATSRFRGLVGNDAGRVTAALPSQAKGKHTDIGAAIDAGLKNLERADTRRLAALILITDGKLDAPGSAYANTTGGAWKQLRTRAAALDGTHQVAAYAVSLKAQTDAGLLKKVFPLADEVSPTQVGDRFDQVGGDLVRLQTAQALRTELGQPITIGWSGELGTSLAEGTEVDARIEITSPYAHVPVELTNLAVQAPDGLQVQLTGLPATISLEPNGRISLPVRATVTGSAGSGAAVGLTAAVSSPWHEALTELGVEFRPALEGGTVVPPAPIKLPPTLLPTAGVVIAIGVALALVLLVLRMLFTPTMSGLLTFRKDGRDVADVVLRGRRMKLSAPEAVLELTGLRGSVSGAKGAVRGERAVRVEARFGASSAKGVVPDGGSVSLGDLEVAYTSGRRRILDKIGLPRRESLEESPELVTLSGDSRD